jgi:hypothetical protein
MKPFKWTTLVITCHHIAIAYALAYAIFLIIPSFIIISIYHIFIPINAPAGGWWSNTPIFLVHRAGFGLAELAVIRRRRRVLIARALYSAKTRLSRLSLSNY